MTTAVLSQSHFRARRDGGAVDASPDWIAAVDTNWTQQAETAFRIRFCVQETAGGNPNAATVKLQANKNGGAFQDVTTSSTIVKAIEYGASAENTAIVTNRLGGTGTYAQGRFSEDGSPATTTDIAANGHSEWEFAVQINAADVANGDTITMKVVALSGTSITATTVPTITVSEAAVATSAAYLIDATHPPKSRLVSAAAIAMALAIPEPVQQPPQAGIASSITSTGGEGHFVSSILVYDMTVTPAPAPAAPVIVLPPFQDDFPRRTVRPRVWQDLSQPVVVPPQSVTLRPAETEQPIRAKSRPVVQESAQVVVAPAAPSGTATPSRAPIEFGDVGPRAKPRKPVNDAAHVNTVPAVVATNTMATAISGPVSVATRSLVYDMTVTPLRPQAVAGASTPAQIGFASTDLQAKAWFRAKPYAAMSLVLAIPFDLAVTDGTDAERPKPWKRVVDETVAPLRPQVGAPATTPTQFWFDTEQPRARKRVPANDLLANVPFVPKAIYALVGTDAPRATRRLTVNEAISAPLFGPRANAATPTQFGFEYGAPVLRARAKPISDTVVGAPVAPVAAQVLPPVPSDAPRPQRRAPTNEPIAAPLVTPVAAPTVTPSLLAEASEAPRAVVRKVMVEPIAQPVRVQAAVVTTPTAAPLDTEVLRARARVVLNDPITGPVSLAAPQRGVPTTFDAPVTARRAPQNEPVATPLTSPVAPAPVVTVVYGEDAAVSRRSGNKAVSEPISRANFVPPIVVTTPTQFAFEYVPANPKTRVHTVVARMDSFLSPINPPVVVVDATGLDDWLVRARRRGRR